MKKILTAITKHLWWRKYYHRTYITEQEALKGRCLICDAHTNKSVVSCNTYHFRDCPCKYNQRLVEK